VQPLRSERLTIVPVEPTAQADLAPPNPIELLRSRSYIVLLILGAIVGIPVAAVAYFFLKLVGEAQSWLYQSLPSDLGFNATPSWWPLPLLIVGGAVVAATIVYLPGNGGEEPSLGFHMSGPPVIVNLPGVLVASFATLACGAVLGPEAPLIAIGGGVAVLILKLIKSDAPAQAIVVIGAAGSFAAISTLLGSPLLGAFLLMEAVGIGGPLLGVILVPGLLAAGIGSLIFIGLDNLTGFGTFSLSVPDLPAFPSLNGVEFLWAIGIGLLAALLGTSIKRGAQAIAPQVVKRRLLLTPTIGALVALAAILFEQTTTHSAQDVLFSGENSLAPLLQHLSTWSWGALIMVVACKGIAYSLSMSAFRGGPVFPSMFIGAAGGAALSHLGGLPMIAGAAMGIGAMLVSILGLPFVSVLLTVVFLQADGAKLTPLVIVAVVVAYVASAWLAPTPKPVAANPEPS